MIVMTVVIPISINPNIVVILTIPMIIDCKSTFKIICNDSILMVIAVKQQEQQKDSIAAMATYPAARWPIAISCLAGCLRKARNSRCQ